jgi:hypothetical protein
VSTRYTYNGHPDSLLAVSEPLSAALYCPLIRQCLWQSDRSRTELHFWANIVVTWRLLRRKDGNAFLALRTVQVLESQKVNLYDFIIISFSQKDYICACHVALCAISASAASCNFVNDKVFPVLVVDAGTRRTPFWTQWTGSWLS